MKEKPLQSTNISDKRFSYPYKKAYDQSLGTLANNVSSEHQLKPFNEETEPSNLHVSAPNPLI